jgi:pimeloyl-ACP methyl ester carboxylesterase
VFYQERGAGHPVVLLHATLHDHKDFDAISGPLSTRYRTIALDWPAHGRSDGPPADAATLARVLVDVVHELALTPAVFIGNSVGGYAAARLAITHPDQVAALVLVNSGGFGVTPLSRLFSRMLGVPAVNRRFMPALVSRYMRPKHDGDRAITGRAIDRARTPEGARTAAALWRSFAEPSYDLHAEAGKIAAPTLLVWGRRDPVLPLSVGRAANRAINGSRLETMDTGHVVFGSDPGGFLDLTLPFLETARPATPADPGVDM